MANSGWTLADARAKRIAANQRLGRAHRLIAPIAAPAIALGLSAARRIAGSALDKTLLNRTARKMNANMEDAFSGYTMQRGDVVASAYVKAGTNWVMYMCHQLAHLGAADFEHVQDVMPWPDAAAPDYWLSLHDDGPRQSPTGYRLIKSHLPSTALPLSPAAKYIAVTRDPKDCAASSYHYFRTILMGPTMPPPDVWLEHCMSEQAIFGRWDLFTATWYALRDCENVLFLRFEDIKADTAGTVDQVAKFLGLKLTEEVRAKVIDATTFKNMKAINDRFYPVRQSLWSDPNGKIIRNGQVGDGRALFSASALDRFDSAMAQGLESLSSDFSYHDIYGARAVQHRSAA